jgi:hypothetical protein
MDDLSARGRVVRLDSAATGLSGAELARTIGLPTGRPVVALAATTAELDEPLAGRLTAILRAVAAVLAAQRAVVVTGGTDAGVIRLLGNAVAEQLPGTLLVGVCPEAVVDAGDLQLEPHHDVSVLVPGQRWGDETATLSRVVDAVAAGMPAVGLLIGGGDVARAELDEHLQRGRPVLLLAGSGRLADQVATVRGAPGLHVGRLDDGPAQVAEKLGELLTPQSGPTLRDAVPPLLSWPRLRVPEPPQRPLLGSPAAALYPALSAAIGEAEELVGPAYRDADLQAVREQNRHRLFVVLALIGGLVTTVFAAMQTLLTSAAWPGIVVAGLGAATSALATVARAGGALDAHLSARVRAERLRSLYFEHIAAAPPDSDREHAERLRLLTLSVVQQRPGQAS